MTAFKPMLAKDGDPATLAYPVAVQAKLDGIRCSIVDGKALSRTLKQIPNREVYEALSRSEFEGLDGEIIVGSPVAEDCYRATASFVMAPNKTGHAWTFRVFDKWDVDAAFEVRFNRACDAVEAVNTPNVFMVGWVPVTDADNLEEVESHMIQQGHEGVIVRTDGPYKFGRSGKKGPLLKIKRFIDFEAEVVGVYEEQHNGNPKVTNALGRSERSSVASGKVGKGRLGGLVLRAVNGPSEGVTFRCGTGFDAAMRQELWIVGGNRVCSVNPLVGRIAKIKSFPVGVKDKPRHPVFLGWRDMEVDG